MNLLNKISSFLNENISTSKNAKQISQDYLKHFNGDHQKAYNALNKKIKELNSNDNSFFIWVNAREFINNSMKSTKEKFKKEKIDRDLMDYNEDRKNRVKDAIKNIKKHQNR